MDPKSIKVNYEICMQLGFEIGHSQLVFDSDTLRPVYMNGKYLIAPGYSAGRNGMEFDPYNNSKMMEKLFAYYAQKEGNIVTHYHVYDPRDKTLGAIECSIETSNGIKTVRSDNYHSDSVKYLDLLKKLNNDENNSIPMNDIDYERKDANPVRKKKNAAAPDKNRRYNED